MMISNPIQHSDSTKKIFVSKFCHLGGAVYLWACLHKKNAEIVGGANQHFLFTPTIPLALKFSQYLNGSATTYFIDGAIFGVVNKHRPLTNLSKILEFI